MTRSARIAVAAAVLVGAVSVIGSAGSAPAAFSPKLLVKGATGGGTDFRVSVGATDDPTARFQLYTPLGTTATFTAAPGTSVGTVTAHAQAADLGGAVLPLTGTVVVANPADPAIVQASTLCDNVAHVVVLVLNLTAAGQTLTVPIFVDASAGAETTFSTHKLIVCLPPPDVPPGTPGRAQFGAKLLDADFTITAITGPTAAGEHRWRALWTPYTPGQGKPNPAGTVETQALVRHPTALAIAGKTTLKTKKKKVKGKTVVTKTTTAIVAGRLTENGKPIEGITLTFMGGASANGQFAKLLDVKSDKDGIGAIVGTLKKAFFFKITAEIPDRDLGASACVTTFAPVPCVSASVSGQTVESKAIKLVPRKK
jgi:hypothetical protein